jgi:hypothetical protein
VPDGEYRIVIANNLRAGRRTDVDVTEVGLVGLDPLTARVTGDGRRDR